MSKRVQELEASCRDHQKKAAGLEAQLREEVARSAPLYGSNLERMTAAQLEGLARLHERGLEQARSLQVRHSPPPPSFWKVLPPPPLASFPRPPFLPI